MPRGCALTAGRVVQDTCKRDKKALFTSEAGCDVSEAEELLHGLRRAGSPRLHRSLLGLCAACPGCMPGGAACG